MHDIVAESSRYSLMAQVDENRICFETYAFPQIYELEMESSLARARLLDTVFSRPELAQARFF